MPDRPNLSILIIVRQLKKMNNGILLAPKTVFIPNTPVPNYLVHAITQEEWARISAHIHEGRASAANHSRMIEVGACMLMGCIFIFLCHSCVMNYLFASKIDK
jgi:hypothetical protein